MAQFLMEAIIVSLAGCFIGIGFSWLALSVIGRVMNNAISLRMNFNVVIIAMIFSMFIGVVFGLYPAYKAAKKRPIDALRTE